jgi:hypothetical protein
MYDAKRCGKGGFVVHGVVVDGSGVGAISLVPSADAGAGLPGELADTAA